MSECHSFSKGSVAHSGNVVKALASVLCDALLDKCYSHVAQASLAQHNSDLTGAHGVHIK